MKKIINKINQRRTFAIICNPYHSLKKQMSKDSKSTIEEFRKTLITIVGQENILFADSNNADNIKIQPYLEESRQRKVGVAFAVVFPTNTNDVAKIVEACHLYKIPMIAQGGNTGRCFGCQTDNPNTVIINLKNMNNIREIDIDNQTITVEAGCILQNIQNIVSKNGLFFPLSLGAEGSCQIGGNLATNAGGVNVLRYGNTRDLTLGIEAVMADGSILNDLFKLRKNNTGYDLKNLLIGSEGTLGIITAATLKLFPPESNSEHGFIAVDTVDDAIKCLQKARQYFADKLSSFELIPNIAIEFMEKHSQLKCPIDNQHPWYIWYKIADTNIDKPLFDDNINFLDTLMCEELVIDATVSQNEDMKNLFWQIRETIVAVQKYEGISLKFDISVPISSIPVLIEKGISAAKDICPNIRPYPFGHLGDGNLHYNFTRPKDMSDEQYLLEYEDKLYEVIHNMVADLGGSFSAEHGVGSQKVADMKRYKDPTSIDLMRKIKHSFDPFNLMNPDKVIPKKD